MFLFKDILLFVFELRANNTITHGWARFSIFFTVLLTPFLYLGIFHTPWLREIFKWWNQQQNTKMWKTWHEIMRNTFVYSMNWTGFCVTSTENRHVGQLTFFFPRCNQSANLQYKSDLITTCGGEYSELSDGSVCSSTFPASLMVSLAMWLVLANGMWAQWFILILG